MKRVLLYKTLTLLSVACISLSLYAMYLDQELIDTVCYGNLNKVQKLIDAGSHVNAQDNDGNSALMRAIFRGQTATATFLLKHDANPNAQNSGGNTALILAANLNYQAIAELLLKYGAHLNIQNIEGDTALSNATYFGHKEIVELLLKAGADVTLKNNDNKTALDIAKERFFHDPELNQEEQALYKELGNILLEAYIKQRKKAGMKKAESRAIFESKKVEVQQLAAQYSGIPAQEIVKYLKP